MAKLRILVKSETKKVSIDIDYPLLTDKQLVEMFEDDVVSKKPWAIEGVAFVLVRDGKKFKLVPVIEEAE